MTSFNEIPDVIQQSSRNKYETEKNITTEKIELFAGSERALWAVWRGLKSDGTHTLYFAYASKMNPDNWYFVTPAKSHVSGFERFIEIYWWNEEQNKAARAKEARRLKMLETIKIDDGSTKHFAKIYGEREDSF